MVKHLPVPAQHSARQTYVFVTLVVHVTWWTTVPEIAHSVSIILLCRSNYPIISVTIIYYKTWFGLSGGLYHLGSSTHNYTVPLKHPCHYPSSQTTEFSVYLADVSSLYGVLCYWGALVIKDTILHTST